jgi:hypothetical protein
MGNMNIGMSNNPNQINFNNNNFNNINNNNNNNLNQETYKSILSEYENKIKILNETIQVKTNEINRLENVISETQEALKNSNNLKGIDLNLKSSQNFESQNLLSQNHLMAIIQEDETRLVAQTAHKTIRTLQELLEGKNIQIQKKDEIIEQLKNNLIKNKEIHLNQVSQLQDQIHTDTQNTMNKLKTVIESVNNNLIVKVSKNQLSTMTLSDIEKLLDEKDGNIKLLAVELKSNKEQIEILQLKIFEMNKRIGELSLELNEERLCKDSKTGQLSEITKLKNIIKEKSELIEEEKERIKHLRENFGNKMEEKYHLEEQLFKYSVHVPERLNENNEKAMIFNKLQSVRNKNKKLLSEVQNLQKLNEENKTKYNDMEKRLEKINQENKNFLNMQVRDTKIITKVKKEKNEIQEMYEKLKEENEKLRKMLNINNEENPNNININNNTSQNFNSNIIKINQDNNNNRRILSGGGNNNNNFSSTSSSNIRKRPDSRGGLNNNAANLNKSKSKGKNDLNQKAINDTNTNNNINISMYNKNITKTPKGGKIPDIEKDKQNMSNLPKIKDSKVDSGASNLTSAEQIIDNLIKVCLKKQLNMNQYLQRYDFSKSGKLTRSEFSNALIDIKSGIVNSDIGRILSHFKLGDDHIDIKGFTKVMTGRDKMYEEIINAKNESNNFFLIFFILFFFMFLCFYFLI